MKTQTMKLRGVSGFTALVATIGLVLATAVPANAISGTKVCPSTFGWLRVNSNSNIVMRPPGSLELYSYALGADRSRVAIYKNGTSKLYGGTWETYPDSSVLLFSPYCSNLG